VDCPIELEVRFKKAPARKRKKVTSEDESGASVEEGAFLAKIANLGQTNNTDDESTQESEDSNKWLLPVVSETKIISKNEIECYATTAKLLNPSKPRKTDEKSTISLAWIQTKKDSNRGKHFKSDCAFYLTLDVRPLL
jgi:hypothetical protein